MPELSVIVVTYNSAKTISRCLGSLPENCEVIVVDNASVDETREIVAREFPHAILVADADNLGFGRANNIALRQALGSFALILNPDAWGEGDAVSILTEFTRSHDDAVACGGSLQHPDGTLQESACSELTLWAVFCEQTFLERVFRSYWISHRARGEPMRVAQVMGACLMLRRLDGAFPEFDERFFLYCEDTELCKRIAKEGEIWYVPKAVFTHALGTSSETDRSRAVSYYNRGKELHFRIHHGPVASFACFLFDRFGALLRLLVWGVAGICTLFLVKKLREKAALFLQVLFAPLDPYPRMVPPATTVSPR